jgi:heat shock protein HtpX
MTATTARQAPAPGATSLLLAASAVIALPVALIALVVGLIVGAAAMVFGVGVVVGIAAALAVVVPAWREAEARVLGLLGVQPAHPEVNARLFNLVDGLCTGAGIPRPGLFILSAAAPNAVTVGRDGRRACLVVTQGMLDKLTRVELEGALAHELCHVRVGDMSAPTVALSLAGARASGMSAHVAARLVRATAPSGREPAADLAAVVLTRYPPGLAAALERVLAEAGTMEVPMPTIPLWLGSPGDEEILAERIEALRDL